MAWPWASPGNHFCTFLKKGDSLLKHNSLICTTPWLPSSLGHIAVSHIYAGLHLGGLCPPQPVSLLGHALPSLPPPPPCHHTVRLPQPSFEPNLFLLNTPAISSRLSFLLLPPMKCSETSAHEIQTPGNHPKERIQWYGWLPCFKTRYSSLPKLRESSLCPSILFLKDIILQCTPRSSKWPLFVRLPDQNSKCFSSQ